MRLTIMAVGIASMIIITGVGIMAAVAAPEMDDTGSLTIITRMKSNIWTVGLAIEDFAVQTDGYYPTSATDTTVHGDTVEDLCPDIDGDGLGDWPINPFTKCGTVISWGADPCTPGDIGINPCTVACYRIVGCGRDGKLIPYQWSNCGPRIPARDWQ